MTKKRHFKKLSEGLLKMVRTRIRTHLHTTKLVLSCMVTASLLCTQANAQISVTATAGITAPTPYTTLNAAFAAINAGTHQGSIQIAVTGNTTEPATPTPLLASGGTSSYTSITIKPQGGNFTINSDASPSTNRGIIELAGADNVTIDGDDPATSGTQNLSVVAATSTTAGIACIRLSSNSTTGADGADNNTIKNCIITGSRSSATSTTTNYGIQFSNGTSTSSSSTGAYSSINTLIENNNITRCLNGIYAYGASNTYPNKGLQIISNTIGTASSGFTDATSIGATCIYISNTATSTSGGSVIIRNNDLRAGASTGYSLTVYGVSCNISNYGAIIEKNKIHDLSQPTSSGYGQIGIYISDVSDQLKIRNNFISKFNGYKYTTSPTSIYTGHGIYISGAATNMSIDFNTINLNGTMEGTASNSASNCITITSSGATVSSLRNNILANYNLSTNAYGLYCAANGNISGGLVDNNNYYTPNCNVGYYTSARNTITAWRTATSKDALSFNADPNFVSADNIHINTATPSFLESTGVAIAGISDDIDGNTRPGPAGSVNGGGTAPDIGADEFDGVPAPAQDLQPLQLINPIVSNISCYTTQRVTVRIRNSGAQPIDLGATNVEVLVGITPPSGIDQTFSVDTLTGILGIGATRDVDVLLNYDMSAAGNYSFDAVTTMDGDQFAANNELATVTRSNTNATVPQFVAFSGYAGDDASLNTQYPGWHEATGMYTGTITYPTNGDFVVLSTTEAAAYGNGAKINIYGAKNSWIISPKVLIPQVGYFYSFKGRVVNYNSTTAANLGTVDSIMILASTNCGSTWTPVKTINSANPNGLTSSLTGFQEISVSLDAYVGQNVIFGLFARRATGNSPDIDFIVKDIQISNCLAPNALSATTTAGVPAAASISWTAPASAPADGYEYKIVKAGVGVDTGIAQAQGTTTVGVTTANVTFADPYIVNYDLYVRSICATGVSNSGWAGPYNFKTPCAAPNAPAENLTLTPAPTTVAIKFNKVVVATNYLIVRTLPSASAPTPINGTTYASGASVNPGAIAIYNGADTTYTNTALIQNTEYRYWIFPFNTTPCTGGPTYYTATPLTGTAITCPAAPINEGGFTPTTQGFDVYWEPPTTGGNAAPLSYNVQIATNSAFDQGVQNFTNVTPTLTITGLQDYTKYWFRVQATNGCDGTWTSNNADTMRTLALGCATPTAQPTNLVLTANAAGTAIAGTFTGSGASNYLVVATTNGAVPTAPVDGTVYTVGATDVLGPNTTILKVDTSKTFNNTGLNPNTKYEYYVFANNHYGCANGPKYLTTAPLHGTDTTCTGSMAGIATSNVSYNGFTLNWTNLTGGGAAPVTYTLQVTTDAAFATPIAGSPFTISSPNVSQVITGLTPETDYYYRIRATNIACTNDWATGMQHTECNPPTVTSSTGGTRCGIGSVSLSATASEPDATLRWYLAETGGSPIASGGTFTTPEINNTTSFWVSALRGAGGSETLGPISPSSLSSSISAGNYDIGTYYQIFNVIQNTKIVSIDVYPTASIGSNSGITIADNSGNVLYSVDYVTTVTGGNTPQTIMLNYNLTPGTAYRIGQKTGVGINLNRNTAGAVYPYSNSSVSITGNNFSLGTDYWYYIYNWKFSMGCESDRTEVIATVTPATPISAGSDLAVCQGGSTTLNATSSNADYTYTWSPATGLSSTTGASVTATPTVNTQYVVNGQDPSGCSAFDTVLVVVNPNPSALTVSTDSNTICLGESTSLTATGGIIGSSLTQNFETFPVGSFTVSGDGATATQSTTNYSEGASSVLFKTTNSNVNVTYSQNTNLDLSTAISAKVTFDHIADMEGSTASSGYNYDIGIVEYSNDGGASWIQFPASSYAGSGTLVNMNNGNATNGFGYLSYADWVTNLGVNAPANNLWKSETFNIPASALTSQFRIRFRYYTDVSTTYYGWLIDNIKIIGETPTTITWSPATGLSSTTGNTVIATPTAIGNNTYTATATSQEGCTSTGSVTLTVSSNTAALASNSNPTTCAGADGSISLSGLSSGATYTVSYDAGSTPVANVPLTVDGSGNATISGLSSGIYSNIVVSETGACNSAVLGPVTLNDPLKPEVTSASTNSADCGIENGKISLNVSNVPAFATFDVSYQKDGGAVESQTVFSTSANLISLDNLSGGVYGNIIVTNPTTQCSSATPYGPVTINTSAVAGEIAPDDVDKTYDQGAGSTVSYTNADCELITTIQATNGSLGTVNAAVIVDNASTSNNGQPYMGRYYALTASNNVGAHVTIYLNQSDIDSYNSLPEIGTEYPAIGSALENLQLTVFHSLPGSGTAILGYNDDPSTKEVITFADMDIVPPSTGADYWSISFDVDSFSLIVPHSNINGAPLPIRLADISAANFGATNRVDWKTSMESVGDRFVLLRSRDAQSFTELEKADAKGISTGTNYSYLDMSPFNGVNYYQLKIINKDGSTFLSKIVSATVGNDTKFNLTAYPNPVTDNLTVKVEGEITGKATVILTDAVGREIKKNTVESNGMVNFSMDGLAQGMYMIKYVDDNKSETIKVSKK